MLIVVDKILIKHFVNPVILLDQLDLDYVSNVSLYAKMIIAYVLQQSNCEIVFYI